ncbi:MAG: HAMP domain-containing protein [Thalassobaculum sp.]
MSFRLKTILGVALVEAVLLSALIVSGIYYLRASNEAQLQERADTTAQLIATMTADSVISTDLATLDILVEQALTNPAIDYVRVRGTGDVVLSEGGDPIALDRPFAEDTSVEAAQADGTLDVSRPIEIAGQVFGSVELGLSTTALSDVMSDALRWMGAVAVSGMLLVGLLGLVLGQYLVRQLTSLRDGARRVAEGEFGFQINVRGRDELADTAISFNSMSAALADYAQQERAARTAAEQRSREAEAILDDAVASMAEAILIADDQGRVMRVNGAFRQFYPDVGEDVLSSGSIRDVIAITEGLSDGGLQARMDELATHTKGSHHLTRPDGRALQVDHRQTGLGGVVIVATDVTELKDMQERAKSLQMELLQAQKMESLGTLAAGIAHEINTPMQFIGDNLRFLSEVVDDAIAAGHDNRPLPDDLSLEAPDAISDSLSGVARVAEIVGSMRSFAHPDPREPEPNDLNQSVRIDGERVPRPLEAGCSSRPRSRRVPAPDPLQAGRNQPGPSEPHLERGRRHRGNGPTRGYWRDIDPYGPQRVHGGADRQRHRDRHLA